MHNYKGLVWVQQNRNQRGSPCGKYDQWHTADPYMTERRQFVYDNTKNMNTYSQQNTFTNQQLRNKTTLQLFVRLIIILCHCGRTYAHVTVQLNSLLSAVYYPSSLHTRQALTPWAQYMKTHKVIVSYRKLTTAMHYTLWKITKKTHIKVINLHLADK